MREPTDPTPAGAAPRWCHWHRGPSGTALLVQMIEENSGPGRGLYACAPCREQRRLTPLIVTERPDTDVREAYTDHALTCQECGTLLRGVIRRCERGAQLWTAQQTVGASR